MKIEIKCYNPATNYSGPTFYLLCKGNNSGKPSYTPFTNSFVVQADDQDTLEYIYWMCWGFWQCKKFHHLLLGSVIPYIRLSDMRGFIFENYEANLMELTPMKSVTQKLQMCNNAVELSMKKAHLYKQLKLTYFHQYVKVIKYDPYKA